MKYAFLATKIDGLSASRAHYDDMYNPYRQGQAFVREDWKQASLDAGLTGVEFRRAQHHIDTDQIICQLSVKCRHYLNQR
jgi:hypothetical protein